MSAVVSAGARSEPARRGRERSDRVPKRRGRFCQQGNWRRQEERQWARYASWGGRGGVEGGGEQAQGCGLTDFFLTLLLGAPEPKMAGAAPHRSGDTLAKWGSTVGLIAFVVIMHSQGLP